MTFPKTTFELVETSTPITEPITKFGGQPVWLNTPQWPMSPEDDEPMLFMAQIALDPELFPGGEGIMAYIFFDENGNFVLDEGIVIVLQNKEQACINTSFNEDNHPIIFTDQATGPRIFESGTEPYTVLHKEYTVVLKPIEEEQKLPEGKASYWWDDDENDNTTAFYPDATVEAMAVNKFGGQPLHETGLASGHESLYALKDHYLLLQMQPVVNTSDHFPFIMSANTASFFVQMFISKDFKQTLAFS